MGMGNGSEFDDLALMLSFCALGDRAKASVIPRSFTARSRQIGTCPARQWPGACAVAVAVAILHPLRRILNACPVFREIGGHAYGSVYPGPIGSVISGALIGPEFAPLAQASSLCGACRDACPVDIDLPKLLTRVRAGGARRQEELNTDRYPVISDQSPLVGDRAGQGLSPGLKLGLRLYSRAASSPGLFAFSQKLAGLATSILPPMFRIPAFTGWGYSKDFPRFARRSFRAGFRDLTPASPDVGKDAFPSDELAMEPTTGVMGQNPVERFIAELTTLGGHAVTTRDPSISIAGFLTSRGIDRIHLEPGLLDDDVIRSAGITISTEPDPSIRAGITRALCGLADTGSILVADGIGSPLKASLLPEVHIAVLETSRILPTLADALPLVRGRRSAVFVTGPSRILKDLADGTPLKEKKKDSGEKDKGENEVKVEMD
jgi:hypothetical protein